MDSVVDPRHGHPSPGRHERSPATTHKLYQQILQEEEVYEKTRVNDERKRKELEQFINRFRAQATRAKAVQSRIRTLEKRKTLGKLDRGEEPRLRVPVGALFRQMAHGGAGSARFRLRLGAQTLLIPGSHVFHRQSGDRIGVIGKNGKGKTTLLSLLAREISTPRAAPSAVPPISKCSYFGQANIDRLHPDNTVEEEIMQAHPDFSRGQARNICGIMLFDGDKAMKKISVLSGGEKSRVLLGKMLVRPANLLLLDEPTNHLDMESVDSLVEAIDAFDGAVVLATHSEMILHAVAEKLIVFDGGRPWLFEGSYQDFLDRVGWQDEAVEPVRTDRTEERKWQRTEKKEQKQMRAEIIAERSRILSPARTGRWPAREEYHRSGKDSWKTITGPSFVRPGWERGRPSRLFRSRSTRGERDRGALRRLGIGLARARRADARIRGRLDELEHRKSRRRVRSAATK